MLNVKNKQLKQFYDGVYRKGEKRHYTKLLFKKGMALPIDEQVVLQAVTWKGKTVLDVGCGTGLMCKLAVEAGAKHVTGIDFSPTAIAAAKAIRKHSNLEFKTAHLFAQKGHYDIVMALGTLEHIDEPLKALRRMKNLLAPGGTIVITSPNWTNPRGYILQTMRFLFAAPITLADLHYLSPIEFEGWARKLSMRLTWNTFDHDWSQGEKLLQDFSRRIPNVMRDIGQPVTDKQVKDFLLWLRGHLLPLCRKEKWNGAVGLYIFNKRQ
jgi:2-polyprenyl-3-methyl-5-hydroxy-6-metoxy-1,4-benzoquinol methylase